MVPRLADSWVDYFLIQGPVALGVALLMAAIVPAGTLGRESPTRSMRLRWQFLRLLILLLIVGYVTFIRIDRKVTGDPGELLVPAMFFLIACFIHVVNCLSLETAQDIRRINDLEYENSIDVLMGIFNRRHFDRVLEVEIQRARRFNQSLSVLMLDLDHFKSINDTYGHPIGDRVLSGFGQLLQCSCRNGDILARYGGEEVVIIARDTGLKDATELAERLREVVASRLRVPIKAAGGMRELRVSASIGIASLDSEIREGRALVSAADHALYEAKKAGRNRVAVSEPSRLAVLKSTAPIQRSRKLACELA